jgi:hypothetical protein
VVNTVTVTRDRHPLAGCDLGVLGRMTKQGEVVLLVVLPDGSKTLMPAAWTSDEAARGPGQEMGEAEAGPAVLAGPEALLQACLIVRALAGRQVQGQAARKSPCKEDERAACPVEFDARTGPGATGESDRIPAPDGSHRSGEGPGIDDRQSRRGADHGGLR